MLEPTSIKRILIYRLGSLGDTIVSLPALHLIERAFPRAERVMLTNFPVHAKAPAAAAVIGSSGLVDRYIRYESGTRNPLEILSLAVRIWCFRPDLLVYLMPLRNEISAGRDRLFFRLCGIRRIVGFYDWPTQQCLYFAETGRYEPEAARLLRMIRPLGELDLEDLANWDLRLSESELARAAEELKPFAGSPYIVCGPGTKMQSKDWGKERWRELLGRLSGRFPEWGLVLVGAREDREAASRARECWQGPVVDLCGRMTPRESAAAMARARLFLGPDSGPMHMAAALGVPCAAAFAAQDLPGRWFPLGSRNRPVYHRVECAGCRLNVCIEKGKICLESISVEEMERAALEALGLPD